MRERRVVAAEQETEWVETLFSGIDHGFCICDAVCDPSGRMVDYRFLSANALFETMTGLRGALGRTAIELVPDLEPHWIDLYARAAIDREPQRFRRESAPMGRWFDVHAAPIEPHGRFVIVFRDVSAELRIEEERTRALERAESLLEELNHRVMNSLGMISAIVALEARSREDEAGRRALQRVASRVQAVGDLHRTLHAARRSQTVQADEYLGSVVRRLVESVADGRVGIAPVIEPIELTAEIAVPLGLMVNELVTNCLKYAYPGERSGIVTVLLRRTGDRVQLVVEDDGHGMTGDQSGQGIGRKLVDAFALQLGGKVETRVAEGTSITVEFPYTQEAYATSP